MTALKARPAAAGTAYADDFYAWAEEQGARLRSGDLSGLDRANPAEEIESLRKSPFASSASALHVALLPMRECDGWRSKRSFGGAISIATHRQPETEELADSPGPKGGLVEAVANAYRAAQLEAAKETGLAVTRFPETCPYAYQDITDRPFAIVTEA